MILRYSRYIKNDDVEHLFLISSPPIVLVFFLDLVAVFTKVQLADIPTFLEVPGVSHILIAAL